MVDVDVDFADGMIDFGLLAHLVYQIRPTPSFTRSSRLTLRTLQQASPRVHPPLVVVVMVVDLGIGWNNDAAR